MRMNGGRPLRGLLRLAALVLICLLALGGGCRRGEGMTVDMGSSDSDVFMTSVLVVIGFVGLGLAASDVEAGSAAGASDYDCSVTNNAGQRFALWADGRSLGEIGVGQTCCYSLGSGAHELYWQPLEYGAEFYDLRRRIEIPAGRYCCRITLEAH